ncbi:hypothetical protein [Companilactobacillus metriopterae]|uniref:hypothetical protein n=1 Tax=Companilactobacillus metriopterae TaxID=1909267 RepID=UPI00100B2E9A|nr:hypothetical protein [Companilactobacillus metriopterae]
MTAVSIIPALNIDASNRTDENLAPSITEDMNVASDVSTVYTKDERVPAYEYTWHERDQAYNSTRQFYRVCNDGYVDIYDIRILNPKGSLIQNTGYQTYAESQNFVTIWTAIIDSGSVWQTGEVVYTSGDMLIYGIEYRSLIGNRVQVSAKGYVKPSIKDGILIINK